MHWKDYLKRLRSPAVVLGLISSIVVLVNNFTGLNIDNEAVSKLVDAICYILVFVGIMNNPDTDGIDLPGSNKDTDGQAKE